MDKRVIADLRERVGRATGADRKLENDIWLAAAHFAIRCGMGAHEVNQSFGGLHDERPPIITSIDAALELAERFRDQGIDAATLLHDALDRLGREGFRPDQPLAPQLARAVLVELLQALSEGGPHAG